MKLLKTPLELKIPKFKKLLKVELVWSLVKIRVYFQMLYQTPVNIDYKEICFFENVLYLLFNMTFGLHTVLQR